MKKAVVLVSGGLDSSTVLSMVKKEGYEIHCLSFKYGQRHVVELEAVKKVIESIGGIKNHKIIEIDLRTFGGSALTDDSIDIPKDREIDESIPVTYVPARNTIFLSYALGYAEVVGARDIFIGAHIVDYSAYPDCRPEYLEAFENMANLATEAGAKGDKFKIHAPLLKMDKYEIIKIGIENGLDYSNTISCYDPTPEGLSCGHCDSCQLRLQAFAKHGIKDPIKYAA